MFIGHSDGSMRDFNLKHGAFQRNALVEDEFHILLGRHHLSWRISRVDPRRITSVRSYSGPSFASCFLISGLSYRTTFNRELLISSFPLYLM